MNNCIIESILLELQFFDYNIATVSFFLKLKYLLLLLIQLLRRQTNTLKNLRGSAKLLWRSRYRLIIFWMDLNNLWWLLCYQLCRERLHLAYCTLLTTQENLLCWCDGIYSFWVSCNSFIWSLFHDLDKIVIIRWLHMSNWNL